MSPVVRWIVAVVIALVSVFIVAAFALLGGIIIGYSTEMCRDWPEVLSYLFLLLPPLLMLFGVLTGSVLIGLGNRQKHRAWWRGAIISILLALLLFMVGFVMVTEWC